MYPLKRSKTPTKMGCPRYDTKLHFLVIQYGALGRMECPFIAIKQRDKMVVPVRTPIMNLVDVFENFLHPFEPRVKKTLLNTITQKQYCYEKGENTPKGSCLVRDQPRETNLRYLLL